LPRKKAAYKAIRKSKLRRFKNISTVSELRSLSKNFEKFISQKKLDEAKKMIGTLVSKIDKAASKGVITKNNASRKVARLMKKLSSPERSRPDSN